VAGRGPPCYAGAPIVAGGLVWTVDLRGGRLLALDPANGDVRFTDDIGEPAQFSTPSAAVGTVVVASSQRVLAYSL